MLVVLIFAILYDWYGSYNSQETVIFLTLIIIITCCMFDNPSLRLCSSFFLRSEPNSAGSFSLPSRKWCVLAALTNYYLMPLTPKRRWGRGYCDRWIRCDDCQSTSVIRDAKQWLACPFFAVVLPWFTRSSSATVHKMIMAPLNYWWGKTERWSPILKFIHSVRTHRPALHWHHKRSNHLSLSSPNRQLALEDT